MTTILAVGIVVMLLMGQHDAGARLREITIPGEGSVIYGQYQGGMVGQVSLPGGVAKSMAYDLLSGMVSNRVVDASGNAVMNRRYQRSRTGGIRGINTEHGDYAYAYDAIDQLTDVGDPVLPDQSFSYDSAGNRRSSGSFPKPGTGDPELRTYAVNNLNQYLSVTSESSVVQLSYDLNGNLTQEVVNGESHIFRWDMENRLVAFSNSANGISASYYYDPFGRRLRKVVNGVTNWYLYADEGLVEEMDAQGNEIRSYGYAPNSLWMNDPLYMRVPGVGTTNIYYFLNDHLGAPQKLVAKNGEVVWSMESEAFGKAIISPDSTIINHLRFSSQYYDEESGLHYNTQRYYEQESGRYVSRDSLGEVGGDNLFSFAQNDPLLLLDPLGEQAAMPSPVIVTPVTGAGAGASSCSGTLVTEVITDCAGGAGPGAALLKVGNAFAGAALVYVLVDIAMDSCNPVDRYCNKSLPPRVVGTFCVTKNPPRCLPCNPPAGTQMYRCDTVPPSKPHHPFKGDHTHHYSVLQSGPYAPKPCYCHSKEVHLPGTEGCSPFPGEIPEQPITGGGLY